MDGSPTLARSASEGQTTRVPRLRFGLVSAWRVRADTPNRRVPVSQSGDVEDSSRVVGRNARDSGCGSGGTPRRLCDIRRLISGESRIEVRDRFFVVFPCLCVSVVNSTLVWSVNACHLIGKSAHAHRAEWQTRSASRMKGGTGEIRYQSATGPDATQAENSSIRPFVQTLGSAKLASPNALQYSTTDVTKYGDWCCNSGRSSGIAIAFPGLHASFRAEMAVFPSGALPGIERKPAAAGAA